MNWQKLLAYLGGALALITLGYLLRLSTAVQPSTTVTEVIRYDTTFVSSAPVIIKETKFIEKPVLKDSTRTYYDNITGQEDSTFYNIQHWITDGDGQKVASDWIVNVDPKYRIIKEYVTRDSVRTVVETKYSALPFFLNPYFWSSLVLVVITALAIIF